MPDVSSGRRGDQHVQVYIHVPKELNEEQRSALEKLAEVEGIPVADESRSFFDRVKDLFE